MFINLIQKRYHFVIIQLIMLTDYFRFHYFNYSLIVIAELFGDCNY